MHYFSKNIFLFILLISSTLNINSQNFFPKDYFSAPLDIPMLLSGNFAELRSSHFHSGIDIKTQGTTGHKIHAIADGYISRIKVSPWGYGYAIYMVHPNGFTSVYGHLSAYNKEIQDYVRKLQYKKQSFSINAFPPKDKFVFKKGDIIGYTGNSGSSGGPHLHFEIRITKTEHPVNPLLFGFNIIDTIPPKLFKLAIYPHNSNSLVANKHQMYTSNIVKGHNTYYINNNPVAVSGEIGFGIEANDYLNNSYNKCGVYSIKLSFDNELIFSTELDEISFSEQRNILSYYDYAYKMENGKFIQKLFIDPNNKLSIYNKTKNRGIVNVLDTNIHTVTCILTDAYDNKTSLVLKVKGSGASTVETTNLNEYSKAMPYQVENKFISEGIKITIPKNALFDKLFFNYSLLDSILGLFSDVHSVHNPNTPLYKRYKLEIKTKNLPQNMQDKALIVRISDDIKNPISYSLGGKWENGYVVTNLREFGNFAVTVDTIAPTIKAINISNGKNMSKLSSIRFKISDDLSGISKYEAYIDSTWILLRYDAKNETVKYLFSDNAIEKGTNHTLKIRVIDNKMNTTELEYKFYR